MAKRKRLKQKKLKQREVATVMVPLKDKNSHFPPSIILILGTLVFLIPFASKAFNIDEPLFLWAAKHIYSNPFDPYGFPVNWYGTEMPMYDIMKNPPLACYYITLASLLLGWSEIGLHMAFLIPAVAVVMGTYSIALYLCERPLAASLTTITTPVFIVSSVTIMCDIMMLAFWVWAVFFWMRGINGNDRFYLAISGILMTAAALTKYYGISLIPLLVVYALLKKRRVGWWLVGLLPNTNCHPYSLPVGDDQCIWPRLTVGCRLLCRRTPTTWRHRTAGWVGFHWWLLPCCPILYLACMASEGTGCRSRRLHPNDFNTAISFHTFTVP
jgi:hypothetical protein